MLRYAALTVLPACLALAEIPDDSSPVVDRYLEAQALQREKLRGVQMQVRMVGSIPKLAKTGSLEALRAVSKLGKVTYEALKFEGDGTVKNHVLVRYLAVESENHESPNPRLAVNKENYKFKNKGLQRKDGQEVYVLELSPRRKEVGLFKGEIWLDPPTMLPVQESGKFVKSPSVFLRSVEFVRRYEIRDGMAIPVSMKSFAETRLVGRTELNIDYLNFRREPEQARAGEGECALLLNLSARLSEDSVR